MEFIRKVKEESRIFKKIILLDIRMVIRWNLKLKRLILGIFIVINCITIFSFSADSSEKSTNKSGRIVSNIINVIAKNVQEDERQQLEENVTRLVRKTAHFTIYMCLGIFTFLYTDTYSIKRWKVIAYVLMFCFVYACSDELHQKFVER